ncbi:MAG: transcriptional regulator, partial [Flavobacteriales bacterium]
MAEWYLKQVETSIFTMQQALNISISVAKIFIHFVPKNIDDFFMDSDQRFWLLSERKLELADHSKSIHIANQQGTLQDVASSKENIYLFYSTGLVTCHNLKNESSFNALAYPNSQKSKFERTSLVVRQGNGFYQLRNGSKGGFFFFDIKKRSWETILETDYTLNTLTFDASGKAYISCTSGIWIIDHKKGKKQYIPTLKKRDGNLLNTEISTVFHDKQGGLWLGTLNQGLLYYHPARYIFKHIGKAHFPKAYAKEIVVQLFAADEVGNIYLKCDTEIYRYRPSVKDDHLLEAVTLSSLPKNVANKFKQPISAHTQLTDIRGWKWTATADGLKLLENEHSKERTFYTSDGLSNNFIHAIFQDSKHQIWITTSYGINKVQINTANKKISFLSFGADVGTLDGEYTDGAVFEHTDGTLYFGGINGFTILEPKSPDVKNLPFKPVFTNLFLRGEKVEASQTYDGLTLLSKSAPYTKTITLLHHQNFLNFEFSGLNYQNPSQTYYRYQLEGIDKQWRET